MKRRRLPLVKSWGQLPFATGELIELRDRSRLAIDIAASKKPGLAIGNCRSYGDVGLNDLGPLWDMRGLDRFLAFDDESGILHCEAGVTLQNINRLTLPRGWFIAVTPGTQFVTVGGAIANDVHGKNHHRTGTFGNHVRDLRLLRTDGSEQICSPTLSSNLFNATLGGMGLTGIIADASIQLQRAGSEWLEVETLAFDRLDDFFELSRTSETNWEYAVSWIDCQAEGRGIFSRGNHLPAAAAEHYHRRKPLRVPLTPPLSLINGLSLRAFNALYFRMNQRRAGRSLQHYLPFFYPLDNILEWNRLYGPKGFYQYQSVVPPVNARDATAEMLRAISTSGMGSPLAVLKTFGTSNSPGLMSFPMEGTTLALDFPNAGEKTLRLFARLDAIVRAAKGRIYPAKDARMPRDLFEEGYPRLDEFLKYRDPGIHSTMATRLMPPISR
jgi:FAD/FMN-containing dehydrogenase